MACGQQKAPREEGSHRARPPAPLQQHRGTKNDLVLLPSFAGANSEALLTFGGGLDNTYSNGLTHVANSETAKRSVVGGERSNTHWLLWNHANDTSFTLLQEFWVFFQDFTGTTVHLLFQNDEFTCDVRGVAIQNWCVTGADLTRWLVTITCAWKSFTFCGGSDWCPRRRFHVLLP